MCVLNEIDRYSLVCDVHRPRAAARRTRRSTCATRCATSTSSTSSTCTSTAIDMPEVLEWTWPDGASGEGARAQRRVELAEGGALRGRAGRGARRAADVVWDGQVGWRPGDGAATRRARCSPGRRRDRGRRPSDRPRRRALPRAGAAHRRGRGRSAARCRPRRRCTTPRGSRASRRPRRCSGTRRHGRGFDTAFHAALAAGRATLRAGRMSGSTRGLRRFGFHGINHEYAAHRAAHLLGRPLESCG